MWSLDVSLGMSLSVYTLRLETLNHSKWGMILIPPAPLAPWLQQGSGNAPLRAWSSICGVLLTRNR